MVRASRVRLGDVSGHRRRVCEEVRVDIGATRAFQAGVRLDRVVIGDASVEILGPLPRLVTRNRAEEVTVLSNGLVCRVGYGPDFIESRHQVGVGEELIKVLQVLGYVGEGSGRGARLVKVVAGQDGHVGVLVQPQAVCVTCQSSSAIISGICVGNIPLYDFKSTWPFKTGLNSGGSLKEVAKGTFFSNQLLAPGRRFTLVFACCLPKRPLMVTTTISCTAKPEPSKVTTLPEPSMKRPPCIQIYTGCFSVEFRLVVHTLRYKQSSDMTKFPVVQILWFGDRTCVHWLPNSVASYTPFHGFGFVEGGGAPPQFTHGGLRVGNPLEDRDAVLVFGRGSLEMSIAGPDNGIGGCCVVEC